MTHIQNLLLHKQHRTFDYPTGAWIYYQEWNRALFLHWEIPLELLRALVPKQLHIDTFEEIAYVSLVAFTMEKIRPRYLPAIKAISNFDEINIRTYIDNNNKKGVYFLNIEAQKTLSVYIAQQLSGLPYEKATMKRSANIFQSNNPKKDFHFNAIYEVEETISNKTDLDKWHSERYCLYVANKEQLYCYDIHHKEWELRKVQLQQLELKYQFGKLQLIAPPNMVHYSPGVQVVAWQKKRM